MARPQVADGGYTLQRRGVVTNSISSRGQPASGGPPALGLGQGLTIVHRKIVTRYKMVYKTSDLE